MNTLRKGRDKLSKEAREKIRRYIESQKDSRVLFMDKSRKEDAYYTAFGLMLSYLFGVRIDIREARQRLENLAIDRGDLIHYAAYIRSLMLLELLNGKPLQLFFRNIFVGNKTEIPVFTSFPHNDIRSPYSQFILVSLMEDMHRRTGNSGKIIESLCAYKVPGGGYSNIAGGSTASVNATSAALSVIGQLEEYHTHDDVDYLYRSQDESGGFYAAGQALVPDILSTATALFVLHCYGVSPRINPERFIEAHWLESGGFAPTLLEENSDIEYTFYGVLALGAC
ncbi:hypothetical protein EZS27_018864 [termite gut metagenome]|uniref:Uncharacterized protein n=1 Tax=termite gut metagenome TaxID=433724 RepID=A0A5J4REW6_9ZZZZ